MIPKDTSPQHPVGRSKILVTIDRFKLLVGVESHGRMTRSEDPSNRWILTP